jgi:hypothetical protein
MTLAVESAEKVKSNVVLGGSAIDGLTLQALEHEKRMDVLPLVWRAFRSTRTKTWEGEAMDHYNVLNVNGGEAFGENMDRFRINWFTKLFEKVAPRQKDILVDRKDLDLFYSVYRDIEA